MNSLIDSHCHIDAQTFEADRDEVLTRAYSQGLQSIICPATHAEGWQKLADICKKDSYLHPSYGLHPMFLSHHKNDDLKSLRNWIEAEQPLAIGECGLDFYDRTLDRAEQEFYFAVHIQLSDEFQLPLIIHARKSVERAMHMLSEHPSAKGVFHSYSGSLEQANILIQKGFYFGFGGPITWEKAHKLYRLVKEIPLEHIILESDAPDQPDAAHRGERNEPSYLPSVARAVANIKSISIDEVARVTVENTRTLFRL